MENLFSFLTDVTVDGFALWIVLLVASLVALVGLVVFRRKSVR